jgi:hypothetical protein
MKHAPARGVRCLPRDSVGSSAGSRLSLLNTRHPKELRAWCDLVCAGADAHASARSGAALTLACHARFRLLIGAAGKRLGRSTPPGCCPRLTVEPLEVRSIGTRMARLARRCPERGAGGAHSSCWVSPVPGDGLPHWQAPQWAPGSRLLRPLLFQ